jgi:hypothetical protein
MTIYDFGAIVLVNFPQTDLKTFIPRVIGKLTQSECTAIKDILKDMFKP